VLVKGQPLELMQRGKWLKIPVLAGYTRDESAIAMHLDNLFDRFDDVRCVSASIWELMMLFSNLIRLQDSIQRLSAADVWFRPCFANGQVLSTNTKR
jgi:hypothetical protein